MPPSQLDQAIEMATILAGLKVEYAIEERSYSGGPGGAYSWNVTKTTYRRGRIVGYDPPISSVILEVEAPDKGVEPGVAVVFTTKPAPGATFDAVPPALVSTVPHTPKRPIFTKLPHRCNRCKEPALILYRTVDCSNWRCENYYLKQ